MLTNLTLDSMKELHARVEAGLAQAKAVLENPNSSQEEVNAQVQAMKTLTEEVNKALAGGLTSPAELGEGGNATPSEASPTPTRGRGRRGQLTPPATPAPAENQETKETVEEVTDYTNGQGSYPLSGKIHHLLQELKTSTENPEQVQKLKEAYDKLNEALGQSENGLVNQEVFNAALEEYKKVAQLKNGVEKGSSDSPKSRKARETSSLTVNKLRPGGRQGQYSRFSEDTIGDYRLQGYGISFEAVSNGKTIREISITGIENLNLTVSKSGEGTSVARLKLTGDIPRTEFGVRKYTVKAIDSSGHSQIYQGTFRFPVPKASFITTNKQLEGKAGTIPYDPTNRDKTKFIQAKLPGPVNQKNIPDRAELRVYLVKGGSNYNGYDVSVPRARGFTKIADGLPDNEGVVTFTPDRFKRYGVDKLGTDEYKLVAMIVRPGTDTPVDGEGAISLLSDTGIRATVDKSDLTSKREALERDLQQEANTNTDGKTEASKQAYQNAKTKVQEAIDKAKEIEGKRDASEADVQSATQKLADAKTGLTQAKNGLKNVDKSDDQAPASPSTPDQSGTSPVTPPSATRNRRTPPRRARRSVGFVGNSQTGTTPSAVDKSELRTLVEELERRLQDLAGLSPEVLEEAHRILGEAQAALANENLTAQELADLLAKVRQVLNSLQTGTSADKSQSASNLNKEVEITKGAKNETEVPLYGVLGAAVLSLLGALLFAVARKKSSQLDKLSRELHQLVVELEASDKDKKVLNKAKKLADEARLFVDSHQKDSQKEAELISEIKNVLSQLK
ncbi:hypothetical protein AZJ07_10455 [Streptococcus pseudopneumoniae]|nr:hypothetical protein AZJ07_10455 [Streptococcus pseudopneumoniae]